MLRHKLVIISALLFFLGLAVRLLLVSLDPDAPKALGLSEPVRIAISLVTMGRYADAYSAGSGPTAHCAPLHPLLLSIFIRLFGSGEAGETVTTIAASMASSLAFALLPALAVAARLKPITGVLAGIAGALLPINFGHQISGLFDAPFTAAALVGLCILMCRIWARARFAIWEGAVLGAATGVSSLLNPIVLPVVAAWVIAIAIKHRQLARRVLVFCGACAACYIVPVMPWAIRNVRALGSPILTRSNFWLEMQVSNNGMRTADMQRNLSMPQWVLVHPSSGFLAQTPHVLQLRAIQRRRLQQLGEVAYMRSKREQAIAWISSHKREFLVLTAQRFRLFWLPRMTRPLQTLLEALLTILGLVGLVLLFQQRARSAWIFAGIFIAYPAVYYVVQASPRYRLPIEPFFFLLAANVFWTFAVKLRMRLGKARWIDHVEVGS